jgi:hypothetical protein
MKNLLKALHAAKLEFPAIKKDMDNPFFKKKYADINSILEQVEPIMAKHGLMILQPIDQDSVCTQIIHVESGEQMTSCLKLTGNLKAQDLGSEITYFRRYSLQSMLALQTEDDDGNAAQGRFNQSSAPKPVAPVNRTPSDKGPFATPAQVGELTALWSSVKEKSPHSLTALVQKFGFSADRKFQHLTFNEAMECITTLDNIVKNIK